MTLRAAARTIAYKLGAMDIFHRARHGECLTALMFHRVLPQHERDRAQADPLYTITPELLSGILRFLKRNYSVVGIRDIISSLKREKALPRRPVLITFDDGWHDNLEGALPVLRDVPWTLFVATDAMAEPECWWQEVLLWALRSRRASYRELWVSAAADGADAASSCDGQDVLALLLRYGQLAQERRRYLLKTYENELRTHCDARHMLMAGDLAALQREGVDIGSHGASHLPLSHIDDPAGDLQRSMEGLRPLGGQPVMSFPHGRYNEAAIAAARDLGFCAIFTSDAILNPCPGGWLQSDVIGRISLRPASVSDRRGTLAPERLAAKLYLRDIASRAAAQFT